MLKKVIREKEGNVIIEASITMTIAVVMVAVVLNLGLMIYQKNMLDAVARETAAKVANVYGLTYRDPMYGFIDDSEFYNTDLYRYVGNIFTSNHDEVNERKAEWYAIYSLKSRELTEVENMKVKVDVIQKPETLIQHQIVVTITADMEMPFSAIWGGNNKTTYVATGKADCIDLLDYFNTVTTVEETLLSKLDDLFEDINKIIGIFDLEFLEG